MGRKDNNKLSSATFLVQLGVLRSAVTRGVVTGMSALALSGFAVAANAAVLNLVYDFEASNFVGAAPTPEELPPPVDSIAGRFGFSFEPQSGGPFQYEVAPDFVDFSILGTDYSVSNTAVQIDDGDVNAITFGGAANGGPASIGPSADDFWIVFFIDDFGGLVAPGIIGSAYISHSLDVWRAESAADIQVTSVVPLPAAGWLLLSGIVGLISLSRPGPSFSRTRSSGQ